MLSRMDTRTINIENRQVSMEKCQIEMHTDVQDIRTQLGEMKKANKEFYSWSHNNYFGFYGDYMSFKTKYYQNFPLQVVGPNHKEPRVSKEAIPLVMIWIHMSLIEMEKMFYYFLVLLSPI